MPACPFGEHGAMLSWGGGLLFCKHSDHGGNGMFLPRDLEVKNVQAILAEILESVLSGTVSLDEGVDIVARRTKLDRQDIRSFMETRARAARRFSEIKSAPAPQTSRAVYGARRNRETVPLVPPVEFMRVMQDAGLTKKEAAIAIGRSVSRVHELTTTQGGNQKLFDNFTSSINSYLEELHKE